MKHRVTLLMLCLALAAWAAPALAERCDLNRPRLSRQVSQALHQAQPWLEKGEDAKVIKLLEPLAKEHTHHQLLFTLALAKHRRGGMKEALILYRQALEAKPCFHNARYNLAVCLAELKKPVEAAGEMLKVYRQSEKPNPEHLYQAALLYLQGEKAKTALGVLTELTSLPNPKPRWLEALAHTHLTLNQPAQAEKVAHRLLAMKPELDRIWRIAAQAAMMQQKYKKAAARLSIALHLKARNKSEWRSLGDLYRASGAPAKAVDCYRRAMKDEPGVRDHDRIAQTWMAARRPDMALDAALKAVSLKPSAKRWSLVGEIHMAERRYKKAERAYAQAASLGDPKGRYNLMRGYAAWQTMDLTRAREAFTLALDKAPRKSSTARQARSALDGLRQAEAARAEEKASAKAAM